MEEIGTAIVGAGVTGVALARALALRGARHVVVLDKEAAVATHTSGRNSGVAHAGYNPAPGTLKARLCVEGNARLRAFCRARGVPLVEGGILVVAGQESELPRLEQLLARGRDNGVSGLRLIGAAGIAAIEPHARGLLALHAPSGASLDSRAYVEALAAEARERGAELRLGQGVRGVAASGSGFVLDLAGGTRLRCRRLVNCAGLHADRLAHALGKGLGHGIVPIRGEYRRLRPGASSLVRSMVYPVPDHDFPFLGVHWTRTAHGEVLIGPNAVPALGREAYSWRRSTVAGAWALAADPRAWRLLGQPGFPRLLWDQLFTSLSGRRFAAAARRLVPAARDGDFVAGPAGIRAQLVDRAGRMVEDLLVEESENALHVLNVVSPGLTCAIALADLLADRLGT